VAALRDAVVASLEAGVDAGGATIDDFRHPDGVSGAFQNEFLVHGRTGEPCEVCGSEIVKFVAAGRGTYACETCQKRPRRRSTAARRPVKP
jgi:formamidopyrimidine-DNA glycosylase